MTSTRAFVPAAAPANNDHRVRKRLYLGGLALACTDDADERLLDELRERFARLGVALVAVEPCDQRKHEGVAFAEARAVSERDFARCFSVLNGTRWRGRVLRVEVVKREHYMRRLRREGVGGS